MKQRLTIHDFDIFFLASEASSTKKKRTPVPERKEYDPWFAKIVYLYKDEVCTFSAGIGIGLTTFSLETETPWSTYSGFSMVQRRFWGNWLVPMNFFSYPNATITPRVALQARFRLHERRELVWLKGSTKVTTTSTAFTTILLQRNSPTQRYSNLSQINVLASVADDEGKQPKQAASGSRRTGMDALLPSAIKG
jgi:hypothetical protein